MRTSSCQALVSFDSEDPLTCPHKPSGFLAVRVHLPLPDFFPVQLPLKRTRSQQMSATMRSREKDSGCVHTPAQPRRAGGAQLPLLSSPTCSRSPSAPRRAGSPLLLAFPLAKVAPDRREHQRDRGARSRPVRAETRRDPALCSRLRARGGPGPPLLPRDDPEHPRSPSSVVPGAQPGPGAQPRASAAV